MEIQILVQFHDHMFHISTLIRLTQAESYPMKSHEVKKGGFYDSHLHFGQYKLIFTTLKPV